ncbi:MAG: vitamin K epoxide reductase family protein [Salinivirgaceae bacterium]
MKDSLVFILLEYLKLNNISIDKNEFEFQLYSHPTYPSMHSITGVLSHFNIENLAIEVPRDSETLSKIPDSYIAHITKKQKEYFVLVIKNQNHIELIYDKKYKEQISSQEFFRIWSGKMVAIEKSDNIKLTKKDKNFIGQALIYLSVLGFLTLFFIKQPNLFQSLHFICSLIGLSISILIVQHELGGKSKILDKFCAGDNKKTSCDDVLNSNGGKLFGNIKFSDVGIIYFASVILSWILHIYITNSNYTLIIALSLLAIPFTLYSVSYQYFVVKKWCPLCLSILVVLWLQVLSIFIFPASSFSLSVDIISSVAVVQTFITISALWFFIYSKLKLQPEYYKLKVEHHRFKNNFSLFNSLLNQKISIDTKIKGTNAVLLGNKSKAALLKITFITNPLCGHCKEAHKVLEEILLKKNENVQIDIRFNVNVNDKNAIDTRIALSLLIIYHNREERIFLKALNDVYMGNDLPKWLKEWATPEVEVYFEQLVTQRKWCEQNNLNFTPEILLNGKSFPNEYSRNDLINFIDDIVDEELEKHSELTPKLTLSN